jgi:hypothetical protein
MAKRKLTKAEREERDAHHEQMLANALRTRELAEKAYAKLHPDEPLPEYASDDERILANVRRTRELAEKAQAKLDAQRAEEERRSA